MLSRDVARALREAGIAWTPAKGDQFVVPDRDLDDQEFVVSDMVIDVVDLAHGVSVLAFNGTTEWALDSLEAESALWVPREDQLRELLGGAFVRLERLPGPPAAYAVSVAVGTRRERHVDVSAEAAYARALLSVRATTG
jgi:hypothetical protein